MPCGPSPALLAAASLDGVMGLLDHRDIQLVAGEDPYACAGTVDVMRPHIRPDGDGGCLR
jgi:phytanoyl-CoA hydroxylase